MDSEGEISPENLANFIAMFGVSPAELESKGIDPGEYIRANSTATEERLFESYSQKHAAGQSLLPYWAPAAWIARSRTKVGRSWLGSVTVEASAIRLEADEEILANGSPGAISVHAVPLWLGMGCRLTFQGHEHWFVQPRYSPNVFQSRSANKIFRSALIEAGVLR